MSLKATHKQVILYTNYNTRRFNLNHSNGATNGIFQVELLTKRGIYTVGDTFTMSVEFSLPDNLPPSDIENSVLITVYTAHRTNDSSSRIETVEYTLDEEEKALIAKGIIIALSDAPNFKAMVLVDNEPEVIDEPVVAAEPVIAPLAIFINNEADIDYITRYDDSAFGHMTALVNGKHQFSFEFSAIMDEEVTLAKYCGGVCTHERIEVLKYVDITSLKVASEVSHPLARDVIDIETDEPIEYTVSEETKELLKQAIIEEIKNTKKD